MRTAAAVLALGVATLAGAARAQSPQPPQPPQPPQALPPAVTIDSGASTLTVQNQRAVPVAIYMEYWKVDRQLGVVPPNETARLAIPAWAVRAHTRVQFYAQPQGAASALRSEQLALAAPARLGMLVPRAGAQIGADTLLAVLPPELLERATLTVDNPRDEAVTVFAEPGAVDLRVGQVPARSRVTLALPDRAIAVDRSVRILLRAERGRSFASSILRVERAQHLALRVPAQ